MLVAIAKSSKASDNGSVRPGTRLHWDLMTHHWTG